MLVRYAGYGANTIFESAFMFGWQWERRVEYGCFDSVRDEKFESAKNSCVPIYEALHA